jgi:hypothetical protein
MIPYLFLALLAGQDGVAKPEALGAEMDYRLPCAIQARLSHLKLGMSQQEVQDVLKVENGPLISLSGWGMWTRPGCRQPVTYCTSYPIHPNHRLELVASVDEDTGKSELLGASLYWLEELIAKMPGGLPYWRFESSYQSIIEQVQGVSQPSKVARIQLWMQFLRPEMGQGLLSTILQLDAPTEQSRSDLTYSVTYNIDSDHRLVLKFKKEAAQEAWELENAQLFRAEQLLLQRRYSRAPAFFSFYSSFSL